MKTFLVTVQKPFSARQNPINARAQVAVSAADESSARKIAIAAVRHNDTRDFFTTRCVEIASGAAIVVVG